MLIADEVQFVQSTGGAGFGVQAREPGIVALLHLATASPHRLVVAPHLERLVRRAQGNGQPHHDAVALAQAISIS